ncbi:MAG: hypothetical protein JG776_275 [Caloramator sp.]|jgi:hypothetical protein|uniref:hypothetical protein n=1 Tax=Caloramator sp. TaxID=1871330 RepID=UPI001D944B43|nr:hypothetical protein [Caloramator sp.]MBZ4662593.1 hypothetical protein [Caloramator sp.]
MPHIKDNHNECEGQDSLKEVNARRIDQLIDLVEKHTRTERHLEEHSNITDLDEIKYVLELQRHREEQIKHLRNLIAYGKDDDFYKREVENIEKNLIYTEHYLDHNKHNMDEFTLQKTMEKQEHRREQLENLKHLQ